MSNRRRVWRTVRARKITVQKDDGWKHLYALANGAMVACRPSKLCPACKLAARLNDPDSRANRRRILESRPPYLTNSVFAVG